MGSMEDILTAITTAIVPGILLLVVARLGELRLFAGIVSVILWIAGWYFSFLTDSPLLHWVGFAMQVCVWGYLIIKWHWTGLIPGRIDWNCFRSDGYDNFWKRWW